MRRNSYLIILLAVSLMLVSYAVSFAADPSQLIVVRASDNSLWKATCVGITCTSFTSFPGLFTSQPAVIWDMNIQKYVLWGRGTDGAIWRSTFTPQGTFDNNWAIPVPGSTPSPPGAAGGGLFNSSWFVNPSHGGTEISTTVSNIRYDSNYCPWDGFFIATSTGDIEFNRSSATGTNFARIYLAETSGGTAASFIAVDVPSGIPTGYITFPYAITRSFSCPSGGGFKNVYVTAEEGGSASGTTTTKVWDASLHLQYVPYVY